MKKIISLVLVLVMCLSLCACGKSQAVKDVETAINAIGDVSLDSIEAIARAEHMYEILTDEEKSQVENKTLLAEARFTYDNLLNNNNDSWNNEKEANRLASIEKFRKYCVENGVQLTQVSVFQIEVEGQGVNISVLVQGEENPRVALSLSYSMTDEVDAGKEIKCITNLVLTGQPQLEDGKYYLYESHEITQNAETATLKAGVNFEPQSFSQSSVIDINNIEKEGADFINERDVATFSKIANVNLHLVIHYFEKALDSSGLGLTLEDFGFIKYVVK